MLGLLNNAQTATFRQQAYAAVRRALPVTASHITVSNIAERYVSAKRPVLSAPLTAAQIAADGDFKALISAYQTAPAGGAGGSITSLLSNKWVLIAVAAGAFLYFSKGRK